MIDSTHQLEADFVDQVKQKLHIANRLFGSPFDWSRTIQISIDNTVSYGAACLFYDNTTILKFNQKMIHTQYERMVSQVIPHEVAHMIGFLFPVLGIEQHNRAWKEVDLMLGGTGEEFWYD